MSTVGGVQFNNFLSARIYGLTACVSGFLFTDPIQAITLGIRQDAKLTVMAKTRKDALGKEQIDAYIGTIEVTLWQCDYASFQQLYYLTSVLDALCVQTSQNKYYNFIKN